MQANTANYLVFTFILKEMSTDSTDPFKMHNVGFRAFKSPIIKNALGWLRAFESPYVKAGRVNSNTLFQNEILIFYHFYFFFEM